MLLPDKLYQFSLKSHNELLFLILFSVISYSISYICLVYKLVFQLVHFFYSIKFCIENDFSQSFTLYYEVIKREQMPPLIILFIFPFFIYPPPFWLILFFLFALSLSVCVLFFYTLFSLVVDFFVSHPFFIFFFLFCFVFLSYFLFLCFFSSGGNWGKRRGKEG